MLGVLQFSIIATLMTALFPWSLLFCLVVYGMDFTKLLVAALLHDLMKTVMAVLFVVFTLFWAIVGIVFLLSAVVSG